MKALMIDIETLSLAPTAKVLQIGFCGIDLAAGKLSAPVDLWIDDPSGYSDPDTVAWWEKQDPNIRRGVFHAPEGVARLSGQESFARMKEVYESLGPDATVWASPAMFDLPILTNFWGGKKPWPYFLERDLMTLYKALDPNKERRPPDNKSAHLASADAFWQAQYLLALLGPKP